MAGFLFLQKVKAINADLGEMTEVYVAAKEIPSRSLIQPDQVVVTEIPTRFVNESYITDVEDLIDKVLVVPLSEGDMITSNMIKPVSNATSENNRLVTLFQSDRLQFDQTLEALDRVDIIVSRQENNQPLTEVFMKDVPVAAVIQASNEFSGVAVEISAEDAPKLIHMQNYADSLRILKANVGKEDSVNAEQAEAPEQNEQQQAEEQKAQEQNDANQEEKKEEN